MKKLRVYTPPFCPFLMQKQMTGRIVLFENNTLGGAPDRRADSG